MGLYSGKYIAYEAGNRKDSEGDEREMREGMEWIKSLKVGDEVMINKSSHWNKNYYVKETVTKITPTGRIKISDGSQYTDEGYRYGDTDGYLEQVTAEKIELMERRELLFKINFDKFEGKLSSERLRLMLQWQEELRDMK
jgi:hypothetical protein